MEEREIDLLDMLLNVLLHWRGIIVFMLAGGILLGAFSYVKSDKDAKALKAEYDAQTELLESIGDEEDVLSLSQSILEEKMTQTQIANVLTVISNEELKADKTFYLDNSILMQVDANEVPEYQFIFAVKSDDMENAADIANLYEEIMTSNGMAQYLSKKFDISEFQASEIVSVNYSAARVMTGTNSFSVSVVYTDKDTCIKIAQAVLEYAMQQSEAVEESFGSHELVVVGEYYSERMDTDLMNTRKDYVSDVISLENSIAKAKDAFSDEEVAYYNHLSSSKMDINEDEDEDCEEKEETILTQAHVSKKYVALGAILFAFLYVCVVAVIYIFDNKIKLCDNISDLYHISQLGQVVMRQNLKKKPLQSVDNRLIALWNRNKRSFSEEEAINLSAVAVKMAAAKSGKTRVGLIGCNMKNGSNRISSLISEYLTKEGMEVTILDNVIYDAEAMQKLDNVGAAVLVECIGSTLYNEIEEELTLLKRQNITVLGGVLVN
jgi:hypothetical protein